MTAQACALLGFTVAFALSACGETATDGPSSKTDAARPDRESGGRVLDARATVDARDAAPDRLDVTIPMDARLQVTDDAAFTFRDAGADGSCECFYEGALPQGACTTPNLTCWPTANPTCGSGECGPQPCQCLEEEWQCRPVAPCK